MIRVKIPDVDRNFREFYKKYTETYVFSFNAIMQVQFHYDHPNNKIEDIRTIKLKHQNIRSNFNCQIREEQWTSDYQLVYLTILPPFSLTKENKIKDNTKNLLLYSNSRIKN